MLPPRYDQAALAAAPLDALERAARYCVDAVAAAGKARARIGERHGDQPGKRIVELLRGLDEMDRAWTARGRQVARELERRRTETQP